MTVFSNHEILYMGSFVLFFQAYIVCDWFSESKVELKKRGAKQREIK